MNLEKIKAILFDLDDTILAFTDPVEPSWQAMCEQHAPALGLPAEKVLAAINQVRDWYWADPERHRRGRFDLAQTRRENVLKALANLGLDRPSIAIKIADGFSAMRMELLRPFPGALETLGQLKKSGLRLGLVTNGEAEGQRHKVERFNLDPFFDCVVIEGEFGVGKPDERVFRHALSILGVTPEETWMVGDNLVWDVAPAQGLGMKGIWVDYAGEGLPPGGQFKPDRIVRAISELLEW